MPHSFLPEYKILFDSASDYTVIVAPRRTIKASKVKQSIYIYPTSDNVIYTNKNQILPISAIIERT